MKMPKLKVWSTKEMVVPAFREWFRVGPWVGVCVLSIPGFVVMLSTNYPDNWKEWRI